MFSWFRGFADPEIARLEAVPGLLPGRATTEPGTSSLGGPVGCPRGRHPPPRRTVATGPRPGHRAVPHPRRHDCATITPIPLVGVW